MAIVYVNDVEVEAEEGETLLAVSRRCAAHIGFVCAGMGICLACVCRVRDGMEHVSPPTNVEKRGLAGPWRKRGLRLACQARVVGEGPIDIISRPEELLRQARSAVYPPEGTKSEQHLAQLATHVGDITLQQWFSFPMTTVNAVYQMMKARPTPQDVAKVVLDTKRLFERMDNEHKEREQQREAAAREKAQRDMEEREKAQQEEEAAAAAAASQEAQTQEANEEPTATIQPNPPAPPVPPRQPVNVVPRTAPPTADQGEQYTDQPPMTPSGNGSTQSG
jgi:ferredoxin